MPKMDAGPGLVGSQRDWMNGQTFLLRSEVEAASETPIEWWLGNSGDYVKFQLPPPAVTWDHLPKITPEQTVVKYDRYGRPWVWVQWDSADHPGGKAPVYSCLVASHNPDRCYFLSPSHFAERTRYFYTVVKHKCTPFFQSCKRSVKIFPQTPTL